LPDLKIVNAEIVILRMVFYLFVVEHFLPFLTSK